MASSGKMHAPTAVRFLTLEGAAAESRVCAKTLSELLKAHPADPPLYARVAIMAGPAAFVRPSARVWTVAGLLEARNT